MWVEQVRQLLAKANARNAWMRGEFSGLTAANDDVAEVCFGDPAPLQRSARACLVYDVLQRAADYRLEYEVTQELRRTGCATVAHLGDEDLIELSLELWRQSADHIDMVEAYGA